MKVQVVGECCIDVYVYGRCLRLSPEAPVPVFTPTRTLECPGMAGNVLANLRALGVEACLYGNNETLRKTRYVEETRNHCLLRVDEEGDLTPFNWAIDRDVPLVVSDYNKGFLLERDLDLVKLPPLSFLDTKKPLGFWCGKFTFIKINEHEYGKSQAFIAANPWLEPKLIVTHGSRGCSYNGTHYEVEPAQVLDVTGAGDTFFAAFIASYLAHTDPWRALQFANACARQVVQKRGTTVVCPEQAALL